MGGQLEMFQPDADDLKRGITSLQITRDGGPPMVTQAQATAILKALASLQMQLEAYENATPVAGPWSAP